MQEYRGLWFTDGEKHMIENMEQERVERGSPDFAGLPTYQFRKLQKAFEFIRNFRVAVDVGAHVGLWTRVLAQMFGTVHSFEPIPAHLECFLRNVSARNVRLYPHALGAVNGKATLTVAEDNTGGTHITTGWAPKLVEVSVGVLDDGNLEEVDFIKIDVEGFEENVLLGGETTIRKCKPCIIVEQKHGNAKRYGLDTHGAVKLLQRWGATHKFEYGGDFCMRWDKEKK